MSLDMITVSIILSKKKNIQNFKLFDHVIKSNYIFHYLNKLLAVKKESVSYFFSSL